MWKSPRDTLNLRRMDSIRKRGAIPLRMKALEISSPIHQAKMQQEAEGPTGRTKRNSVLQIDTVAFS